MKFSEKQLTILTVGISGVLALVLAGVGYFVLRPKLNKTGTDLAGVENKIKQAQTQKEEMYQLEARVKTLGEEKKYLKESLPTKEELVYEKFIDTLYRLEQDADVTLLSASAVRQSSHREAKLPAGLEKISYQLKLTGGFFELIKFVYLLETYKRFIKVDEFSLKPKNISGAYTGEIIHSMNIKITTYTYTYATK